MRRLTIVIGVFLTVAACGKKKDDGGTPTTGSGATGSGSTVGSAAGAGAGTATMGGSAGSTVGSAGSATGSGAGSDAVDPTLTNKAGNCPSAVAGATTVVVDEPATAGKLVLAITAKNEAATDTIRKRVAHLIEVQAAPDAVVKHSGDGTGGGVVGMCPVLTTKDVKLSATDIEGGSKVVLEPQNGVALDTIRKDVEARVSKTTEWAQANLTGTSTSGGGGGIGGGKGEDGSNHSGKGDGTGKGSGTGGGGGAGTGGGGGAGGGGGKGGSPTPPTKI